MQNEKVNFTIVKRKIKIVDYMSPLGHTLAVVHHCNYQDVAGELSALLHLSLESKVLFPKYKYFISIGTVSKVLLFSYSCLIENNKFNLTKGNNMLVLLSLAFLHKTQDFMASYGQTDLYLDNDTAGQKAMERVLLWSENISDRSYLYEYFKDLNAYICDKNHNGKRRMNWRKRMVCDIDVFFSTANKSIRGYSS